MPPLSVCDRHHVGGAYTAHWTVHSRWAVGGGRAVGVGCRKEMGPSGHARVRESDVMAGQEATQFRSAGAATGAEERKIAGAVAGGPACGGRSPGMAMGRDGWAAMCGTGGVAWRVSGGWVSFVHESRWGAGAQPASGARAPAGAPCAAGAKPSALTSWSVRRCAWQRAWRRAWPRPWRRSPCPWRAPPVQWVGRGAVESG